MGTHTSYYVTFEFHNGSRRELEVKPKAYAMIVEGDRGSCRTRAAGSKDSFGQGCKGTAGSAGDY